jgi:hypothetical protein
MYFKELELGFWTPCLNKQLDSDRLERCWELLAGGFPQPRAIPDRDLGSCMTLSKLFYPILSPVFPYENGINNYYHIYCAWLLWKLMEALKIWNIKYEIWKILFSIQKPWMNDAFKLNCLWGSDLLEWNTSEINSTIGTVHKSWRNKMDFSFCSVRHFL